MAQTRYNKNRVRVSDLPKQSKAVVWQDIQANNPRYADFLTCDDGIQAIKDMFGDDVALSIPSEALSAAALESIPAGFCYSVVDNDLTEEPTVFGPAWCRASPLK